MDNQGVFHAGAMILCGGCGGEAHVSENDGPADRPFRCRSCRQRSIDSVRINHPELFQGVKRSGSDEVSDSDIQDKPSATRKRASGNRETQQESNP